MTVKYRFFNDYSEGAHPRILEALSATNAQQEAGYGEDSLCQQAIELIKQKVSNPNAAVHFVSGGTQANLISLAALMKPYEAVIAATTGHINVHEAGAIEATGHKVIALESANGKLCPTQIAESVLEHQNEHMVKPRVIFISQSTEIGTFYSKQELIALSEICKQYELYLYVDGARLGSGLTAKGSNVSLADLARLADVFYIGGTKNGALLGEAIVINNPLLQENFRYYLKQHGALLAKSRLLGIQFLELFRDDLFFELARHANAMAEKLQAGIKTCGYRFLTNSITNQIFPILPNDIIEQLQTLYGFYIWSKVSPDESSIRLVTSWATQEVAVEEFIQDLQTLFKTR